MSDELFEDAVRLVMDTGQASSSMLQRKFRIGYTRAARLVDCMEELGLFHLKTYVVQSIMFFISFFSCQSEGFF